MDDADWTARGLFSPSKARHAQAQARDWELVEAWLSKKYISTGRVPAFERNDATLRTLLDLISINNQADERRSAVERVEQSALQFLSKQNSESAELSLLNDNKSVREYLGDKADADLENLARSRIVLDVSPSTDLLTAASDLQIDAFEAAQAEARARAEVAMLKAECDRLTSLKATLQSENFKPSDELAAQTAEWNKGLKVLKAKIGEYEERSAALKPSSALSSLVDEASKLRQQIASQRHRLDGINMEIGACHELPDSTTDAEAHVERARQKLEQMKATRSD